jgi:hypothetical protein
MAIVNTRAHTRHRCPHCGSVNDRASGLGHDNTGGPVDGDVSLCFQCAEFGVFDRSVPGGVREPTPEEVADIRSEASAMRAQAELKSLRGRILQ